MAEVKCKVCGEREVWEHDQEKNYCEECWKKKRDALRKEQDKFRIDRTLRTKSAEVYLVFHEQAKKKRSDCGEIFAFQNRRGDSVDVWSFLLVDQLNWKEVRYKDKVEEVTLSEVFADVVADLVRSWGGGTWYLNLYYGAAGEEYEGEV